MAANPRFYFDNRLADDTPIASSTAAGNYAAANVADMRPYTWWKAAGALPATLTVNSGVSRAADSALVYGHNMKSVGASLEVHGSTDNFAASDVTVATYTPASDDPFVVSFGSVSYPYWRAKFTGATPPAIAICVIGAALEVPVGLAQSFDPLGRTLDGQDNQNENGHPLGRVVNFEGWEQDLLFEKVTWSWLRGTWKSAWASSLRGAPAVFAWDAVTYPTELIHITCGMQYKTPHFSGSVADLQLKVRGRFP